MSGTRRKSRSRTGGASGEIETAGLVMNIVPKAGGNVTRGSLFASGTGEGLQADNLTTALHDQGVSAATPSRRSTTSRARLVVRSCGIASGTSSTRTLAAARRRSASVFYNLNAGDPTRWLYAPDYDRREYSDRTFENASGRVTWQIDAAQQGQRLLGRAGVVPEVHRRHSRHSRSRHGSSPEAIGILGRPLDVVQATWSSPVTNRLLLEAGFGGTFFGVGNFEREPNPTRDLIRVTEQCASGCAANGNIPGLAYRSQDFSVAYTGSYLWKGSLSSRHRPHSLKIGYQHTLMTDDRTWMTNNQNLTYRFNNGVPNQLTQSISPWVNNARAAWDGLFVQEQWTRRPSDAAGRAAVRPRARAGFPRSRRDPRDFFRRRSSSRKHGASTATRTSRRG